MNERFEGIKYFFVGKKMLIKNEESVMFFPARMGYAEEALRERENIGIFLS